MCTNKNTLIYDNIQYNIHNAIDNAVKLLEKKGSLRLSNFTTKNKPPRTKRCHTVGKIDLRG